jgi:hypothetical protein
LQEIKQIPDQIRKVDSFYKEKKEPVSQKRLSQSLLSAKTSASSQSLSPKHVHPKYPSVSLQDNPFLQHHENNKPNTNYIDLHKSNSYVDDNRVMVEYSLRNDCDIFDNTYNLYTRTMVTTTTNLLVILTISTSVEVTKNRFFFDSI